MTTPIKKHVPYWMYLAPSLFGIVRAAVGTPLEVIGTKEILEHKKTLQILRETALSDYVKGFQPNALKFITRTPFQAFVTKFFSSNIPTELHPAVRGFSLGLLISSSEAFIFNIFNSTRTRFIHGERWRNINPSVVTKGLTAALGHRALSSTIFFSFYEPLKVKYPSHGMAVSTFAGVVQVVLTAPLYIAAIERQRKNAVPESLYRTMERLTKNESFIRALVIRALIPRLVHTIAITGFFMKLVDDQLGLIHRKQ
jgi:hypothetical protein